MERGEIFSGSVALIGCVGYPQAYLITFSCYGSHLHGSEKGSVDRDHNLIDSEPGLRRAKEARMSEPSYALDYEQRQIVLEAIRQVCVSHGWTLIAAHVRTSHVHVVAAANAAPEIAMQAFKAYASRSLGEREPERKKRWTRHGSTRYLWKKEDVAGAVRYVVDGQGPPMAVFFNPEQT